jgi:hypothetical protein
MFYFMMTMVCLTALVLLILFVYIVTSGRKQYTKEEWVERMQAKARSVIASEQTSKPGLKYLAGTITYANDQTKEMIVVTFDLQFENAEREWIQLTPQEIIRHADTDVSFLKEIRELKTLSVPVLLN